MPSAMSIHFESDHPFIAVPLECETIEDLQDRIDEILKKPYDMIAFDAGCFNGTINLSQLFDLCLIDDCFFELKCDFCSKLFWRFSCEGRSKDGWK